MENEFDELNNSEKLLNALLPFAQEQLEKKGEFIPFGATIDGENKEIALAMATSDENADSQKMIDMMTEGFRSKIASGKPIIAAGICFNTGITLEGIKKDAICVAIEAKGEKALNIFVPYKKSFLGKISYEELSAGARESTIFN